MTARRSRVSIPALPDGSHREAGRYDNAGRWYPDGTYHNVPGAFRVRAPSRAWPYSYLKHWYTRVYSRALLMARPVAWFMLMRMDPRSEAAAPFVALVARERMHVPELEAAS